MTMTAYGDKNPNGFAANAHVKSVGASLYFPDCLNLRLSPRGKYGFAAANVGDSFMWIGSV